MSQSLTCHRNRNRIRGGGCAQLHPSAPVGASVSIKVEPIKFVAGSKLMKELQKILYFATYEKVFSSGTSMTNAKQQEKLRECVVGNRNPEDYMTLTEQMVLGINQFVGLYDEVPIAITDDRNTTSVNKKVNAGAKTKNYSTHHKKSDFDLELKECFFPQKTTGGTTLTIFTNKLGGITEAMLMAKNMANPVHVSGLTISRGAKEVLRNGRKALAIVTSQNSEYKDGKLPSGKTIDDYHRFVRESMYIKLKGKGGSSDDFQGDGNEADAGNAIALDGCDSLPENENDEEEQDNDAAVNGESMPEDYYFVGMLSIFLWGHITADNTQTMAVSGGGTCTSIYQSKMFQIGDSPESLNEDGPKTKNHKCRKQVKKEAAEEAARNRNIGTAVGGGMDLHSREELLCLSRLSLPSLHL